MSADASRRWRQRHPEAVKEQKRRYYARHAEQLRAKMKPRNKLRAERLRQAVFALLGDSCQRCGFDDQRAVHIDHIHGGGRKDRNRFPNREQFLQSILASPEGYQLLCANCNSIKRYERHEFGSGRPIKVLPFPKTGTDD